jgi:hypothetical protein
MVAVQQRGEHRIGQPPPPSSPAASIRLTFRGSSTSSMRCAATLAVEE